MNNIRLDMIGLVVKEIAESLRFYRALGLEIPEPDGGPYHEVALDGGIRLSWNTVEMMRDIDPDWTEPVGQRIGLAFLCESPAAVDLRHDALVAEGFASHKEPWDAFWGQRYAQVQDPDGNVVDLFCPLAG
jgi:catechol 2,3-dioxygenase-like lactoylglutathione lyase family enzyme